MKPAEVKIRLDLVEVKPGLKFDTATLSQMLPNFESALFFGKTYGLDPQQLSNLLYVLFGDDDVVAAFTNEGGQHSEELQDYIAELGYEYLIEKGTVELIDEPPPAAFLPEVWAAAQVTIAASIQEVAEKLADVVGHMPGKEGQMMFSSMMKMNARRPIIGDYKARIHHAPQRPNLVIFDVSGSMSESTVKTIVDDVVALSWAANASLAIVSNTTTFWNPGEFSSLSVLEAAEFGGTHYETLTEILNKDWGVVVCIADYDSSPSAKSAIASCNGEIELLLDISLVNQPTYLSQCVGLRAGEVRPLLVAANGAQLCHNW